MKNSFLFSAALLVVLAGCGRQPDAGQTEADRQRQEQAQAVDEKIAQLQELERRAGERAAAEGERERQRIAAERDALEQERDRLADARAAADRKAERSREEARAAQQRAGEAEENAREAARRAEQDRASQTVGFFYAGLEPHGEWMEEDRYGYVWQPQAAKDPRWRPYTRGRWVFTDYGWTWKSDEPFGWAVYHYGRWARVRRVGWVWVPGSEWGPAWVSWRRGNEFVGWAPLPPGAWSRSGFNEAVDDYYDIGPAQYTFVPVESLGESTYAERAVEPERNVTIINQTTNVTNIEYTNVQNTTVVFNAGPNIEEVNSRSTQKVPRLTIERVTDSRSPERFTNAQQQGNTLRVTAPRIEAAPRAAKVDIRVGRRLQGAEEDHGWSEAPDRAQVDRARQRVKQEARQAEDRQRAGVRTPARAAVQAPVASQVAAPAPAQPSSPTTPLPAKITPTPRPPRGTPARAASRAEATPPSKPAAASPVKATRVEESPATPDPATPRRRRTPDRATPEPLTPPASPAEATPQPRGRRNRPAETPTAPPAASTPSLQDGGAEPAKVEEKETSASTPQPLPSRPRRGRERGDGAATPPVPAVPAASPASLPPEGSVLPEGTPSRRPRAGRGEAPSPDPASPIASSPQPLVPAPEAATPDRRRPRALRPRPDASATAPAVTPPAESSTPATPAPALPPVAREKLARPNATSGPKPPAGNKPSVESDTADEPERPAR